MPFIKLRRYFDAVVFCKEGVWTAASIDIRVTAQDTTRASALEGLRVAIDTYISTRKKLLLALPRYRRMFEATPFVVNDREKADCEKVYRAIVTFVGSWG